jgi:hypothetical protein
VKARVAILSLALVVGAIVARGDAVRVAFLLGVFVCGVVYLVLRVREHRREKANV